MNNNESSIAGSKLDTILAGTYRLIEEIGTGSYGCLLLGQHVDLGTYHAIKVLTKSGLNAEQLTLQRAEIDIHQHLKHENIVALERTIEDDDFVYIVLELCDQGDLFDYAVANAGKGTSEDDQTLLKMAGNQIIEALVYSHEQGIYHRDIKLENVLLQMPDNTHQVNFKLADFGLATKELYSNEYGCGSASYLAPEHFNPPTTQGYNCASADVWSTGIFMLAVLFGRNPWQEASLSDPVYAEYANDPTVLKELFPGISDECYKLVQRCLAIDPEQRLSMKQVLREFQAVDHFLVLSGECEEPYNAYDGAAPVSIPQSKDQYNGFGHSYDSAFCGSWSDLIDQDGACDFNADPFGSEAPDDLHLSRSEEDLFAQNDDSWWI
ncbi:cAMP-dependent protein kinase catalytic subunit [Umbelopsis sp. WA50703]